MLFFSFLNSSSQNFCCLAFLFSYCICVSSFSYGL
nr:MAG TPA: hypothetical protein [Caudoviricetes sp.]